MVWNGCDFQRTQTNLFTHHLNYGSAVSYHYSTLPSPHLLENFTNQ